MSTPLEIIAPIVGHRRAPEIIDELGSNGLAIVPKEPTKEMVDAAWAAALAEKAEDVWRDMIEAIVNP